MNTRPSKTSPEAFAKGRGVSTREAYRTYFKLFWFRSAWGFLYAQAPGGQN